MPFGLPQRFSAPFSWRVLCGDAGTHSAMCGRVFMEELLSKIQKNSDSRLSEAAFIPPPRCQILPYVCFHARPASGTIRRDPTEAKLSSSCSPVCLCATATCAVMMDAAGMELQPSVPSVPSASRSSGRIWSFRPGSTGSFKRPSHEAFLGIWSIFHLRKHEFAV